MRAPSARSQQGVGGWLQERGSRVPSPRQSPLAESLLIALKKSIPAPSVPGLWPKCHAGHANEMHPKGGGGGGCDGGLVSQAAYHPPPVVFFFPSPTVGYSAGCAEHSLRHMDA